MTKTTKLLSVLLTGLLVILIACDRRIDSKDPIRSLPETGTPPQNLQVGIDGRSVVLSWEKASQTNVSGYRLFLFDSTFADTSVVTKPIQTKDTTGLRASFDNLTLNQLYYFQVAALFESGLEGSKSAAAVVRIVLFSLEINGDAKLTNNPIVQVSVNSFNLATHMMISEDSAFASEEFKPFAAASQFTLSDNDGSKTLYGSLLLSDGSRTLGLLSDDIILDTKAEIDSVTFVGSSGAVTTGDTVRFMVYAGEAGGDASVSFGGVTNHPLCDDTTCLDGAADDGVYTGYYVVPVNFSLIDGVVTGSFTDEAGNSSTKAGDSILSIYSTPLPVNLSAIAISTYEVSLSWTLSLSSDFLAYRIYRSMNTPVTISSDLIQSLPGQNTASFTDTTADSGSTYYYRVFVFTTAGNSSESNEVSVTTDSNPAPSPVVLSLAVQADASVLLTWTVSDETDFHHYSVRRDNSGVLDSTTAVSIINPRNTTNYTSIRPDTLLTYYFQVFVHDRHGLMTGSNILSVP